MLLLPGGGGDADLAQHSIHARPVMKMNQPCGRRGDGVSDGGDDCGGDGDVWREDSQHVRTLINDGDPCVWAPYGDYETRDGVGGGGGDEGDGIPLVKSLNICLNISSAIIHVSCVAAIETS